MSSSSSSSRLNVASRWMLTWLLLCLAVLPRHVVLLLTALTNSTRVLHPVGISRCCCGGGTGLIPMLLV